ncbi:MAG: hypothetical protein Ta2G_15730 [Termitinemataceae bacterium]|nr:MAG: hypothetical protein Ta2G_15730 [Termitinemataceae bacterium]
MKTAIILQTRLDSSRLPRKALLDLCGEPLVCRVMQALNAVAADIRILACPKDSFDELSVLAGKNNFEIFAGSKDDVLRRYVDAIKYFELDKHLDNEDVRIIRATGDNPFVFADASDAINAEASALGADYAAYANLPYGAGVEAVSAAALLRADKKAESAYDREHVCPFLYGNPAMFKLHRPLAPLKWQHPECRITVDEAADYENAKKLYAALTSMEDSRYTASKILMAIDTAKGHL